MTGSMYAAIAGLRTHMQNLNVIGNNIANVNTESYKSARSVFRTSIYTTNSGGSDGTAVVGGRNPSQIGYGSNLASVDIDMSTGTYKVTGKSTDLMLDGDGFFLIGDKTIANNFDGSEEDVNRLTSFTLTRLGAFDFGADGYLTAGKGNVVYGFLCTGVLKADDIYVNPNPPEGETLQIKPGMEGKKVGDPIFSDQLVPIRIPRYTTTTRYFSADGTELTTPPTLGPDGKPTDSTIKVEVSKAIAYPKEGGYDEDGNPVEAGGRLQDADESLPRDILTAITFDENTGLITGTSKATNEIITIGCLAIGTVINPNGVTQIGDTNYKAGPGSGDLVITTAGGVAESLGLSQVNGSLRQFNNANNPDAGGDAGAALNPIYGLNINTTRTTVKSNGLESSKADLAQEIANMIVTQRGYQANTRIITVTDSMLEELVNMKR